MFSYECWVTPDSWPYLSETNSGRAGFFFAVKGVPEATKKFDQALGGEIEVPRILNFKLKNMSMQSKLLGYGHSPVYLEISNKEFQDLT